MSTKINPENNEPFTDAYLIGREMQQVQTSPQRIPGGKPYLLLQGTQGELIVHQVEHLDERPARIDRRLTFSDSESFIRYINDFRDEGTRIWALFGNSGGKYQAVLDYHHDADHPRWGSHVADYSCPTTPEWDRWIGLSGKPMTQDVFADFVEEQRLAFIDPDVATMLEISRSLEASTSGKFESKINPQNGSRTLVYVADTTATAGGSAKLSIPNEIVVRLQPFRRGAHYQVKARLVYRIREGKVTFQYDLIQAHVIIETAMLEISTAIEEQTGIKPYNGSL